ncbi:putative flavin carrier protein 3 [Elasticomyces elasticus]|nr:putative flavin carrier protein 3 [Elasticomyces elasticus]KAK3631586.1 putative flavin carrier protein 3 [Elasticomyces elasticus]KAK4914088.1 putative flavin carrier protein 3 [Elasticomyces elasticus]KAK5758907.1 putative flavin carrier protein 3 [Elasticomyces elasticus]
MKPSLASLASCALAGLATFASAEQMLYSDSLNPCQTNNNFSATQFDVILTPKNNSLSFSVVGVSTIQGNITIDLVVSAYGLQIYQTTLDPCALDFTGLCPMNEGQLNLPTSNVPIPANALSNVPGIAYTIPDLDAKVKVYFNSSITGQPAACVEAELSNGKTVDQKAVAWALAVISVLALLASAVTSGLGHSNTAAHVAANALALFGYFQAQAFMGMTAVNLPPIVASWTQNFQWSLGIIRLNFLQSIATWYQRATGGKPSTVLSSLGTTSVEVQKRSLDVVYGLMKRAAYQVHDSILRARTNADGATGTDTANTVIVRGIQRVGFRAGIEVTNIFLTGYIFFLIFVVAVVIGVLLFKLACEALIKMGRMKGEKFQDFRNGWTTVLKGILFRVVLIGFPQMVVLCFWEFTRNDSTAEMVLAVFTIFTMLAILAWASSKVVRLARRSVTMHKNPAYILYSDPAALNKWGFLYVQFKATAYYFIVPFLIYILAKGLFIALAQGNGVVQAIGLVVIEAVYLIIICVLRPYMDKKTNAFNISITVINFISAIFLLVFTGIFGQPGIVTGVMGVIFFIYNAVFSTVLLILVLIASIIAVVAKNPDTRYQPMRDDRGSFIKSQTGFNTELDALGATARGESKHGWNNNKGARIEDDDDSWSGGSSERQQSSQLQNQQTAYGGAGPKNPPMHNVQPAASPYDDNRQQGSIRGNGASPSPWQRGAGYD